MKDNANYRKVFEDGIWERAKISLSQYAKYIRGMYIEKNI